MVQRDEQRGRILAVMMTCLCVRLVGVGVSSPSGGRAPVTPRPGGAAFPAEACWRPRLGSRSQQQTPPDALLAPPIQKSSNEAQGPPGWRLRRSPQEPHTPALVPRVLLLERLYPLCCWCDGSRVRLGLQGELGTQPDKGSWLQPLAPPPAPGSAGASRLPATRRRLREGPWRRRPGCSGSAARGQSCCVSRSGRSPHRVATAPATGDLRSPDRPTGGLSLPSPGSPALSTGAPHDSDRRGRSLSR